MKSLSPFWKYIICAVVLSFNMGIYAQTSVPDPAFEQYLIDDGFDTDGIINGQISAVDALSVNVVNVNVVTYPITDFTGLEDFVNLIVFYSDGIDFTTLDISTLTSLQFFSILRNNTLSSLDVTNNSALREFLILGNVSDPPITEIDVSQNLNLTTLQLRNLRSLNTIVYPTDPTILEYIWFQNLSLNVLDFADFDSLIQIIICCNLNLNTPIVLPTETQNFRELFIQNMIVGTIDVSPYPNLETLQLENASLTDLDISQNIRLKSLDISFNQLDDIQILEDYFNHRLNDGLIDGAPIEINGELIERGRFLRIRDNNFSGTIPNLNTLVYNSGQGDRTANFTFDLRDNKFHFGDFEADHAAYLDRTTIPWSEDSVTPFASYIYAGQKRINEVQVLTEPVGSTITLSANVRGAQNHYRWLKDGVELVDAPDSPQLLIFNVTPCDAGIYYALITSDLVPFETGGPPGSNGRNLELRRNNITLTIDDTSTPVCPMLVEPMNGDTNVPVNTGINWESIPSACGYLVTVETAAGMIIIDNEDVSDAEIQNFDSDLPDNTEILVTINPYFANGSIFDCDQQSFTTGSGSEIPDCPTLLLPRDGSTNIPVNTQFIWEDGNGADSYFLEIGISSGDTSIFSGDLGDTSPAVLPMGQLLPENTLLFATLSSVNEFGMSDTCIEISFTTEQLPPACVELVAPGPINGSVNVSIDTDIFWTSSPTADSYSLSVGPVSGSASFFGPQNVGNVLMFDLPSNLPNDTEIFVTVIPVNEAGNGLGCDSQSFITTAFSPPECTMLTLPLNGATMVPTTTNLEWEPVVAAESYAVTVGTTSGAIDVFNQNVGTDTFLDFPMDLNQNQEYFVTITPTSESGEAIDCQEESFITTVNDIGCTIINQPEDGDIDVPIDTVISWEPLDFAEGYRIDVGTTSGGTDIFNQEEVTTGTQIQPTTDLPEGTEIFVTITPFSNSGVSENCQEESFTTIVSDVGCTLLTQPQNGDVDVPVNTILFWESVDFAQGYHIDAGTTSGGTDIFNQEEVTNGTQIQPTTDLPEGTEIFVTITPFSSSGPSLNCQEESFTTIVNDIGCTLLTEPQDGDVDVPVNTILSWEPVNLAQGYRINVGTTSGDTDIFNQEEVTTGTQIQPNTDLPEGTEIFVTITPFSSSGSSLNCQEESFTTIVNDVGCTLLTEPLDGDVDVPVNAILSWEPVNLAEGYRIDVGTTSGGTDIFNQEEVTTGTQIQPTTDLPEGTEIFVRITPFSSNGASLNCQEESFTTIVNDIGCTLLTEPQNGDVDVPVNTILSWEPVDLAEGYRIDVGTTSGATDIFNQEEVTTGTQIQPTTDLPEGTEIFVTITPFSSSEASLNCQEESFVTVSTEPVVTRFGFSPDGDGINEFWKIPGIERYPNNTVAIYNRWGDQIFEIRGYDNTSNVFRGNANKATKRGAGELPQGTYFFTINIPTENTIAKAGYIILKR